jgi:hypothetical protein
MPLETATTINDLVATNPTATDPASAGDDHIRLIKSALLATFPNVAGAVTATHTALNDAGLVARRVVIDDGVTAGAVNVYTVAGVPTQAALVEGLLVLFTPHITNTGASTLNLDGLGAKSIRRRDLTAVESGDLVANTPTLVVYNATLTQFILLTEKFEARPLPLTAGGTGAISASAARTALELTSAATGNAAGLTSGTLDAARLPAIPDANLSANVPLVTAPIVTWDSRVLGITKNVVFRTTNFTVTADMTYGISAISAASDITITFGADLPAGFHHTFIQSSTGKGVFAGSGVSVVNRQGHTKTAGQYARVTVEVLVDNSTIYLAGDTGA